MKVTAIAGQTLLDVAIQVYGSIEGVFTLAVDNGLDVTADITPGQVLVYTPANVADTAIVEYFVLNGIVPATAFSASDLVFDRTFNHTFNGFDYEQDNS